MLNKILLITLVIGLTGCGPAPGGMDFNWFSEKEYKIAVDKCAGSGGLERAATASWKSENTPFQRVWVKCNSGLQGWAN